MKLNKQFVKRSAIALGITLVVIQVFRIDKNNPSSDPANDFITINNPPPALAALLKTSCYDCHSNQSAYPWYTNLAPVSWWIKHHINEGRDELNFSEWDSYTSRRKDHKLKECAEMVSENEMPMSSYTLLHSDAKLSTGQKEELVRWLNSLRTYESDKPKK